MSAVQRPRLELQIALGKDGHLLQEAVAVALLRRKRQEDVKFDGSERHGFDHCAQTICAAHICPARDSSVQGSGFRVGSGSGFGGRGSGFGVRRSENEPCPLNVEL